MEEEEEEEWSLCANPYMGGCLREEAAADMVKPVLWSCLAWVERSWLGVKGQLD